MYNKMYNIFWLVNLNLLSLNKFIAEVSHLTNQEEGSFLPSPDHQPKVLSKHIQSKSKAKYLMGTAKFKPAENMYLQIPVSKPR